MGKAEGIINEEIPNCWECPKCHQEGKTSKVGPPGTFWRPLALALVLDLDLDQDQVQRTQLVFASRTRRTDQGNGGWTTARWDAGS